LTEIDVVLKSIPEAVAPSVSKSLLDIILKSKNAPSLPSSLARQILGLYHDDLLSSKEGFKVLMEASVFLEKDKTAEKLQELNLNEAATNIRGA